MKKQLFTLIILFVFTTTINGQKKYPLLWKKVQKFELDNLPKSALKVVDKIYDKANTENNAPQIIKTLFFKSKFSLTLEEDAQLKVINEFKRHIALSKFPTKNVLENVLANLYWQYFNQNRWKFYNRTKTNKKVDKTDFRTWDLNTLFVEIHQHYQASLQNGLLLQQTNLYDFTDILHLTKDSKKYRPTLFDFLAHNALVFYKTSETNITKPAYQFKIDNPRLLGFAEIFATENIQSKDTLSLQLNGLKIYQELINFHLKDKNPTALADVDLERLQFVRKHATFSDKKNIILQTLHNATHKYRDDKIAGLYAFEIAKIFHQDAQTYQPTKNEIYRFENKRALEQCEFVIKKYPKSEGAKKCKNLKAIILTKSLQITAEKNIEIDKFSRILVRYKNIHSLHFTAYRISKNDSKKLQKLHKNEDKIAFINRLQKETTWTSSLKNEADYQQHTTEVIVPKLAGGTYLLIASENKKLTANAIFGTTQIQVTNLAFIVTNNNGKNSYQVVHRSTGRPIYNANVTLTNKPYRRYGKKLTKHFSTDKNGEFQFNPTRKYYYNIRAIVSYKNDLAQFGTYNINGRYRNKKQTPKASNNSFLFTDRSMYRPNQTVYFKGILMETFKKSSTVLADELVFVTLFDVNNQKVKELELTSNEFGSFAGEFILPNTGLTGGYRIAISGSGIRRNSTYFSVEEYKRPKFETEFKPIAKSYKMNDSVTVNGFATAFSGAKITDAKVVYRVYRKVQYPRWWYWYRPQNSSESQEITHGESNTDAKGNYKITFKALADKSVAKADLPIFNYEITADVTDINGETHSSTTVVKIGYHSLTASIEIAANFDKTSKKQAITIATKNLNGEFVAAKGRIHIYKLVAPKYPLRKRTWKSPDYQVISKDEFTENFPNDAFKNEDNFRFWKKGNLVFETDFDTQKTSEIKLKRTKKWTSGNYIIELETQDKFGQKVTDKQLFTVFAKSDKLPSDNQLFSITSDKKSYAVGDSAQITFSSNSKDVTVKVSVEKQHKIVATHFIHLNKSSQQFYIPITKKDEGGFAIKYHLVNYNSFIGGQKIIAVPYPTTDLEITTNTFRDKLQPGSNQTWSFTIKGAKKDKVFAEVLASMHDASLDQFKPHNWQFNPIHRPLYNSYNQSNARQSFGNTNFRITNIKRVYSADFTHSYDRLNWFGFSFIGNRWTQRQYIKRISSQRKDFQGVVTGIVEDESGGLPGVSVLIKGTTYGTETDFDGKYSLKVNKGDVLTFQYIGYQTVEKIVGDFSHIYITLKESEYHLDEVVVTGYGSRKKRKWNPQNSEVAYALQGKVAGVAIQADEEYEEVEDDIPFNTYGNPIKQTGLNSIQIRKNFKETAFFYPQLKTNKNGEISFNFTIPEALTRWKLQLVAHTKNLHSATKTLTTVTQKELMIVPNAPRFLREGDKIILSAKVSNLTDKKLTGVALLSLTNPLDNTDISMRLLKSSNPHPSDGEISLIKSNPFTVDKNGNTTVSWELNIPNWYQAIQYKITARAGNFSDGEQNVLPVLSNRMLVTETLPMWLGSNQTKTFSLKKLVNYKHNYTLKHHKLTLEMTSNPAWYAVQALPYLMEYPYECAEQTFARYYANTLASFIANSNPKIQEVFNSWKSSDALLSNLEKNQELKSIIIQETPWLRDAQSETEQKKRIALLFDLNKMKNEQQKSIHKLQDIQMNNGGFPWFKGGRYPNAFITQHIAVGFGHLQKLGVAKFDTQTQKIITKAVRFLDTEIEERYQHLLKEVKRIKHVAKTKAEGEKAAKKYLASNHLGYFELQYLYMRSFYSTITIKKKTKTAIDYYTKQSATYWNSFNLYAKGQIALIQFRTGDKSISTKILQSLKENSITSNELGMYWKSNTAGYYYYQAPVETQALMIEVFAEIENDTKTVDNLKIWLLKNKQTNRWKTTKATTEAVYALLLQGSDWLSVTDMVDITVGDKKIDPKKLENVQIEAGTGYFKTSWNEKEITPKMGKVTIRKNGKGIAWGSLYWQYFEDLDKITSAETPLKLSKKLFLKTNSDTGKVLTEITSNTILKVGDLMTVRIELRSDRNMEFIHLKDMRASGVEPINVLSRYKWQDGLGYYQSTKDAATNFFFDRLPKGVYVFEYDVRVNNAGNFSNGISTIQSMYAPEFSSHSKGVRIVVK